MENPADSSSALGVEPATSSRTGDAEQSVLEEPKDADAKTEQSRDEGIEQKAHDLMDRITSARSAPNPRLLHALASLLEQEEARFMQESGHSSPSNARSSHDIGRLGNLLRENDEFFELVSSKFLSDTRYTIGVSAAAARLLLACPSTSMYPLDFEDDVLENIKRWAMEDMVKSSGEECHPKLEAAAAGQQASDAEMLKTYATGLLALALNGNGPVVEDVLTCGLSAKLMRFLRIRVLGETGANQKDIILGHESRQATGSSSIRAREDIKGRMRHVADATRPDFSRLGEEALPEDQNVDKDIEKVITMKEKCAEECPEDGEELKRMKDTVDMPDEGTGMLHAEDDNLEQTAEDKKRRKEWREGKSKLGGNKPFRDEDVDENARDDPSKRRAERGCSRYRGKARVADGVAEAEKCMASPGTGIRFGSRTNKDRITSKQDPSLDFKNRQEDKISELGHIITDTDENDDTDKDCRVGTKDISEMVKRARRAAEAEARAANAPHEAVKAAGDAAAELVKSAATEVLSNTNDEDAAIAAASNAATAVEDAALSTEVSRNGHNVTDEGIHVMDNKFEKESEPEGNFVLDSESLASLREQFSIQCLERLGEYVEVLGPVLHEKGIDVCLALLQRESKTDDSSKSLPILSDLLKLICALAAHRKFAALFVDRGGIQKLLVVPRVSQTFTGISMCLFAIGSLQGVMERICALPFDVVQAVVELALQLLECSQDQARKHAALFFGAAFVFRAVLDAFDAKDGLQKMLNLLRNAANVRAGVSSGASGTSSITSPRNDRATTEVLTAAEKQIAYHTSVALRQYFRAHLLLLVDTLRPNKSHRGGARNAPSARAAYKPIDTSNEAIEAVIVQLQRDRKLGPAFVRARWPAVEKFLSCNGHTILLELSQAPPGERYLHELALFALGVLHIVTLVPNARRLIVGATLSNERLGMAVILDAASGATYGDPEQVIHSALLVLVNLVCPPPSLSSKPVPALQGQNALSSQVPNGPLSEGRERNVDKTPAERTVPLTGQNETKERNGDTNYNGERNGIVALSYPPGSSHLAAPSSTPTLVGDRRISLGPGAGCAGLAAYMEQGYRQAREAVRANNGIKVLLHLLHPRTLLNPSNLDSIRALACRVLLGLAKDDTIAHILTKLQVGKMLSELVRDTGSQMVGSSCEQGKWQAELSQVAMELIAIATNAGRASTLAATDAAAPTLRRIERAAIAAATPITYHSKELLQLIHEHLVASGLQNSAETLLKEAQLAPLPSLAVPHSLPQRVSVQESSGVPFQWPSGRVPGGFLSDPSKLLVREDDSVNKCDPSFGSSRKKALTFSLNLTANVKTPQATQPSTNNVAGTKDTRHTRGSTKAHDSCSTPTPTPRANSEAADLFKTPNTMPMKRKTVDRDITVPLSKRLAITDPGSSSPICMTPNVRKSILSVEIDGFYATPSSVQRDKVDDITCSVTPGGGQVPSYSSQPGLLADPQSGNNERATLDSLVVQYLKHQHRQCPAPITTLPPLSLLHPHVCPEPSRALDAPFNTAGRLSTREFRTQYGGMHGHRRDRQFVFSRFRPLRTCRDDPGLLTSVTFLGSSTRIATGSHAGELKIFDTTSGNVLESHACHQSPITLVQCTSREIGNWSTPGSHLLLSSCNYDVRLWDSSAVANGQLHIFDNCRAARFNHTGSMFAAISSESSRREVLLYDVQSCNLEQRLSDSSSVSSGPIRVHTQSLVHFSPSDAMLLWNGVLWDHRVSRPIHRFDQFTDYGGGGFHPAGNEVIINSEVWDLRKFRLLRSVPSLDQTVITFNSTGDIIYATLRRNVEDVMSALNTRRARHPLFAAFRTMDAVHYSDIATTVVDRCVLDLATEPTDSLIGLVAIDDSDAMDSSARIYEVGRRRPTDDDSDPDDGLETEEEDDGDSEADEDVGEDGLDVDGESDMDISNEDDDSIDEGEDGDFDSNEDEDGVGGGILRIISDDEGSQAMGSFSSDEDGSLGEFDEEFMIL